MRATLFRHGAMEAAFRLLVMSRLDAASWLAMRSTCRWARSAASEPRAFDFGPQDDDFLTKMLASSPAAAWAPHEATVRSEVPWDAAASLARLFSSVRVAVVSVVLPDDAARLAVLPDARCEIGELQVEQRASGLDQASRDAILAFARARPRTPIAFVESYMWLSEVLRLVELVPPPTPLAFDNVVAQPSEETAPLAQSDRITVHRLVNYGTVGIRAAAAFGRAFPRVSIDAISLDLEQDASVLRSPLSMGGVDCVGELLVSGDSDAFEAALPRIREFVGGWRDTVIRCTFRMTLELARAAVESLPLTIFADEVVLAPGVCTPLAVGTSQFAAIAIEMAKLHPRVVARRFVAEVSQ